MTEKNNDASAKLLALISHKLRTPLSIINGYADALAQKGNDLSSSFSEKAIEEIYKQSNNLGFLVDRLLKFTKAEEMEPKDLLKTPVSLKNIIIAAARAALEAEEDGGKLAVKGDVTEKGPCSVEVSCPADLTLMCDEITFKTALTELIVNAVKFNAGPSKTVKIYCLRHNNNISVSVKDNGPGIRPSEISKIFEKFYQIDEYFTGQVAGWGLGLPFVKRIAELHGGTLSVVSDKGLGSVFTLTVPN